MQWFDISTTIAAGLLLRFGVPILVTVILIFGLKQLDKRWQLEAARRLSGVGIRNSGCWEINKCAEDKRVNCRAYQQPEMPCWQVFRETTGVLTEKCLGCKVFREAPLPA